jgi:uncharacterized protein YgbK (DUF1537 family)
MHLGPALSGMPLVTAGSGVAIALPANFGLVPSNAASALPPATGAKAIISGSCSQATNRQVRSFIATGGSAFPVDPLAIAAGRDVSEEAIEWCASRLERGPVLVYSTAEPGSVNVVQEQLGAERAGTMIEQALARIARGVVERGVRQLVVAGGETSGACVQALDIRQMQIGPQIDPGVPWCYARTESDRTVHLHLALKSGNFGADDFFPKAFAMLA